MNWEEFEKKHDIDFFWKEAREKTKGFLERPVDKWFFRRGYAVIKFIEEAHCYMAIFNHFLVHEE